MDVFSKNAKVKLVYIKDSVTSKQEIVYQGDITGFRNNLSVRSFSGFNYCQHFTLIDEEVKILNKIETINTASIITNVVYYVGPEHLDPYKITF